jgi:competence protein ComEC
VGLNFEKINFRVAASNEVKIVFCDVGQGDAILLIDGQVQILVDAGGDGRIMSCLRQEMPVGDRQLELVVLSHSDEDHFGGLNSVLLGYRVKKFVANCVLKDSADFQRLYELVWEQKNKYGLEIMKIKRAQKWCESARICFEVWSEGDNFMPEDFWQKKEPFEKISDMLTKYLSNSYNYNNGSIVLNVSVMDKKLLLTGDVERTKELAMVKEGLLRKIDILKVPHHGSKSSSTWEFLTILQPEYCVIMSGVNNAYGHPHRDTLSLMKSLGSKILRTDLMGTIKFIRNEDGGWRIETEKNE